MEFGDMAKPSQPPLLGLVVQALNSRTQEAEADGFLWILDQSTWWDPASPPYSPILFPDSLEENNWFLD